MLLVRLSIAVLVQQRHCRGTPMQRTASHRHLPNPPTTSTWPLQGDHPATAAAILTYAYYWYNFMPLARGTAAVGYSTILALFWAAGMPVTSSIPSSYQVDWEAILAQRPQQFREAVSGWLLPPQARGEAGSEQQAQQFPPVLELPPVTEVLGTMRARLEALNGPDARRI
jgi:hypothetical protein